LLEHDALWNFNLLINFFDGLDLDDKTGLTIQIQNPILFWIVNHNPIHQIGLQSGLSNPTIQSSNTLQLGLSQHVKLKWKTPTWKCPDKEGCEPMASLELHLWKLVWGLHRLPNLSLEIHSKFIFNIKTQFLYFLNWSEINLITCPWVTFSSILTKGLTEPHPKGSP